MISYCELPFQRLKITSEGFCSTCCLQWNRGVLGNILEPGVNLHSLWNNEAAQELRAATATGGLHDSCNTSCCPFYHKRTGFKEVRERVIPIDIELDLPTQHCNVGGENPNPISQPACLMCERSRGFVRQEDRLDEICEKLKPYKKNFRSVHVQGVAEPFWKNRIFEILEILQPEKHTQVTTTTNGTILTDERMDRWLRYPSSYTTFSIDAASPENYRKIRILDAYEKVLETIRKMVGKVKPGQAVQISNNINLLNIHEVRGMVRDAAECGVERVQFNPTVNFGMFSISDANYNEFSVAKQEILDEASKRGIEVVFLCEFDRLDVERLTQIRL